MRWFVLAFAAAACARSYDVPAEVHPALPGSIALKLSSGGSPAAGARVKLPAAGAAAQADAQGAVAIGGVPEGVYAIEAVSADGAAVARVSGVTVLAGQRTDLGAVALASAGSLHGKISLPGAQGNAGAVVFLPGRPESAVTGDDGSWRIGGLPPGKYAVAATSAGYALARSSEVQVDSAGDAAVPELQLAVSAGPRFGSLSGAAKYEARDGLHGDGIGVALLGAGRTGVTDDSGNWRFDNVPEGRYTVAFSRAGSVGVVVQGALAAESAPALADVVLRSATGGDLDGDGIPDSTDPDIDGDGVPNDQDAFPLDPAEWADSDGDGVGDNHDNCPFAFNPDQADSQHDGVGDACRPRPAQSGNLPPSLSFSGPSTTPQGQTVTVSVTASDPENDAVSLIARDLPAHATFATTGPNAGAFTFTPSFAQSGPFTLALLATDGHNLVQGSATVLVTAVPGGNTPPQIAVQGATSVRETDVVLLTATASDAEGQALTLQLLPNSTGGAFTDDGDGTGAFRWATGYADSGTYPLTFRASDGIASTDATVLLSVGDVVRAPVISAPLRVSATVGKALSFAVSAGDPDGTPALAVSGATPSGAAFVDHGDGTGTFSWTPPQAAGNTAVDVTFAATVQAQGAAASTHIEIAAQVTPPSIAAPALVAATVGQATSFTVTASDPDGMPSIALQAGAPGALVDNGDGTASFSFTPSAAGSVDVGFVASFGNLSALASTHVDVAAPAVPAPVLAAPTRLSATQGVAMSFNVSATHPSGPPALALQGTPPTGATFTDHADGTGTFAWTPDAAATAAGGANLTFVATAQGVSATASTRVDVYPPTNTPPALTVSGSLSVDEGQTQTLTLTAVDAESDPISLFVQGAPANAGLVDNGNGSGVFTFRPGFGQAGTYSVTFVASDGKSVTQVAKVLTVVHVAGNTPPSIAVAGNVHVTAGQAIDLSIAASDPDVGQTLALTVTGAGLLPAMQFTDHGGGSGTFHWATLAGQQGSYALTFTVSDGQATASQPVTLLVDKLETPVVLAPLSDHTIAVGNLLTVTLSATDADGDAIFYSLLTPHTGAALSGATFTFTPTASDYGQTLTFTFAATDNNTAASQQSMHVSVPPQTNTAPAWDSVAAGQTVAEGSTLTVNVRATDPDPGNTLVLHAVTLPANATLVDNGDGTGSVIYSPDYAVVTLPATTATVSFTISADDGHAGVTNLTFSVTVTDVDRAPSVTHQPDVTIGTTGSVTITTSATDPDPGDTLTYGYVLTPSSLPVSQSGNKLTVTPVEGDQGAYTCAVTVTDSRGKQASDSFAITVRRGQSVLVPNTGGAAINIANGWVQLDAANDRLIALDPVSNPSKWWSMALQADPLTQVWVQHDFAGCSTSPCYPQNSFTVNDTQTVIDTANHALWLFRTSTAGSIGDAWRMSLTSGSESWTEVDSAINSTAGCSFVWDSSNVVPMFDGTRVGCARVVGGSNNGRVYSATSPYTSASYTQTGTITSATSSSFFTFTAASTTSGQVNAYALVSGPSGNPPPARVVALTMGSTSTTSVDLTENGNVPGANTLGALALDTDHNRLLLFGGTLRTNAGLPTSQFWSFDLGTGLWTQLIPDTSLPVARERASGIYVPTQKRLYIAGGCQNAACSSAQYSDLWVINVDPASGGL